jgi:hypothetical protein
MQKALLLFFFALAAELAGLTYAALVPLNKLGVTLDAASIAHASSLALSTVVRTHT